MRITNAKHPLDASAVHPERYALVEQMAKDLKVNLNDLIQDKNLRQRIDLERYVRDDVGMPYLARHPKLN
ncbi:MAG: hypothetical protein R2865_01585 [Deinococcales bacterium]